MSNLTTFAIKATATSCAIGLVMASAGFGAVFAYKIGIQHNLFLAGLSVLMALALEGVKPIAIAGALKAFRSWEFVRGLALILLGTVAVAYSLTSELTLMSMSRGDLTAQRRATINQNKGADEAYKRATLELEAMQPSRTIGELKAKISEINNLPGILIDGKPCGGTYDGPTTKTQCPIRAKLIAELARAQRRVHLQEIISSHIKAPGVNQVVETADPGSTALATYLGAFGIVVSVEVVSQWLSLVQVLALEIGSALAVVLIHSLDGGSTRIPTVQPAEKPGIPTDLKGRATVRDKTANDIVNQLKNQGGFICHSERRLAEIVGADRSTVRRAIHSLASRGVVAMDVSHNGTVLRLLD